MSSKGPGKSVDAPEQGSVQDVFDRVAKLVSARNDSDIARALGTTPQAVSVCRKRGSVPYDAIVRFAATRGASIDYLLLGKGTPFWGPGEIDLSLYNQISMQLWFAAHKALEEEKLEVCRTAHVFASSVSLIYNRMLKRIDSKDDETTRRSSIEEEVKYLVDLSRRDARGERPLKLHPEEMRHFDRIPRNSEGDFPILGSSLRRWDTRREVSVEIDGGRYTGYYTIHGKKQLRFTVHFDGKSKTDGRSYGIDQLPSIEIIAKQVLLDLIKEGELKHSPTTAKAGGEKASAPNVRSRKPRASR